MKKMWSTIYTNPKNGQKARFEYEESDSFDHLDVERVKQVYGVCFFEDKMIVVKSEFTWILPGGTRESGESIEQTLRREIKEETNMEVLEWKPVGIQTVYLEGLKPFFQLRTACKVKPYGVFKSDPDGDITEIKLIDPKDYKDYFDWGEIGNQIISRAIRAFD